MNQLAKPVSERMTDQVFQSEVEFENRFLKPLGIEYTFFGEPRDAYKTYQQIGWPSKIEREKPDFYVPSTKQLFECVGHKGNHVRIRTTKPISMAYWALTLKADVYFALWNSKTETGCIVPLTKVIEVLEDKSVHIEEWDNQLYAIPCSLLGI